MANELTRDEMQRLARLGAQARLDQLDMERRAILQIFPDLAGGARRPRGRGRQAAPAAAAPEAPRARRSRRKMSAAARKAVSDRMRKYWADRRKAKGKAKE